MQEASYTGNTPARGYRALALPFLVLIAAAAALALSLSLAVPEAHAATGWWRDYESGALYCSDSNGGVQYLFHMGEDKKGRYIVRILPGTYKQVKFKYLPKAKNVQWELAAGGQGALYLNRLNTKTGASSVYMCDIKTKKLTKVAKNMSIRHFMGGYLSTAREGSLPVPDISHDLCVYKPTAKGLKKVATLAKTGEYSTWLNYSASYTRIRYVAYPSDKPKKAVAYECKANGKGVKKLGTVTCPKGYDSLRLNAGAGVKWSVTLVKGKTKAAYYYDPKTKEMTAAGYGTSSLTAARAA